MQLSVLGLEAVGLVSLYKLLIKLIAHMPSLCNVSEIHLGSAPRGIATTHLFIITQNIEAMFAQSKLFRQVIFAYLNSYKLPVSFPSSLFHIVILVKP